MDARTATLARTYNVIPRFQQGRPIRPVPRDYIRSTERAFGPDAVIEEMIEALEDYSAQVIVIFEESEVADAISKFLASRKATSVVVPISLDGAFKKAATHDGHTVHEDSREQAVPTLELDEVDTVATRCHVAISPSGTIVLDGEPDQSHRAISPVPDTHVVMLRASGIVPTVPQAVEIFGKSPTRPMAWIAGGSAIPDVELIHVNGVHGPRLLRVVIAK